jgi:hypothetical protein
LRKYYELCDQVRHSISPYSVGVSGAAGMVGCTGLGKLSTERHLESSLYAPSASDAVEKSQKNIVIVVQDGTIERPVLTVHSAQVIVNGVLARLVSRNRGW